MLATVMAFQLMQRRISLRTTVTQIFDHQMGFFVVCFCNVMTLEAFATGHTPRSIYHAVIEAIAVVWLEIDAIYLKKKNN